MLQDRRSVNLGSVYETVVAQELKAHGFTMNYYDNKQKGEVDFLIDDYRNLAVLPIEVKSGKNYDEHSALDRFLSVTDYGITEATVLCELCEFNDPISRVCYRAGQREEETRPKYELIGTHAGRRTFICFALSSGIPPQVVMKWTGHSDYKAMKPYIDIAERTKADAMKVIEDAWSK